MTKKQLLPKIIDYGQLTSLAWPGKVSAAQLIREGVVEESNIKNAIKNLNDYYAEVDQEAAVRCIDGRHDPKLEKLHIGPQVPGGAPGAALAYRLGVDKYDLSKGTFLADAEVMIEDYLRLGFPPGGHRDDHADGKNSVGCGAIDGMDKIVETMISPALAGDHLRMVAMLMGDDFDIDVYLRIMGAAVIINGRADEYFRNRQQIIDKLEKRAPGSIATVEGNHQECLVVVNLVPNTTFKSNDFSDKYNGMQAFGYDLWRTIEMAEHLLPRPDQETNRKGFITARIMTAVATTMALTDGSQRLILRLPS